MLTHRPKPCPKPNKRHAKKRQRDIKKSSMGTRDALPPRMKPKRRRLLFGVVAFAAGAFVVLWIWGGKGDSSALRRLPPDNRAQLYQQTLAATRTLCDAARTDDALADRCASWAEFLLEFPECDDACRAFATPFAPRGAAR